MNNLKNCSGHSNLCHGTGISMPQTKLFTALTAGLCFMFSACGPGYEKMQADESRAEASSILNGTASINTDSTNGLAHNFIRTASLKFKVNNVMDASKNIEDLLALNGGYVSKSDLSSPISYHSSIQTKKDSVLEISYYTTTNFMTLRVPSQRLDTLLRRVTNMAAFVDYRRLSAEDIKLKLAGNKLEEARLHEFRAGLQARSGSKNTKNETATSTENTLLDKQAQIDASRLESYGLAEQVNYSTVTLELYQDKKISTQLLAKAPMPEQYVQPFTDKMGDAFLNGFGLLKSCILLLLNGWGLIGLAGLAFFMFKKIMRQNREVSPLPKN